MSTQQDNNSVEDMANLKLADHKNNTAESPGPAAVNNEEHGITGDIGTASKSEAAPEDESTILELQKTALMLKGEIMEMKEQALKLKEEALVAQADALEMKRECLRQWEALLRRGQIFQTNMSMLYTLRQHAIDARKEAVVAQEQMMEMMTRRR